MEKKYLVLVGGGGHCKSVIDVAESAGYTILAVLDTEENLNKKILNYPITGTDDMIPFYKDRAEFLVTVGHIKDASLRIGLHRKVEAAGCRLATIIASSAYVSEHASVGAGSVVMHRAFVNAGARVGQGCIINTLADIEHDALIGDYCHISTGAMINGDCRIGGATFIGSQSVVGNGISVAGGCVVAAGSVIRKNLLYKGIYSGNPAVLKIKL